MSIRDGENSNLTSENMEQEQEIKIEETTTNWGYVKKELENEEPEFQENQYKTASNFENISEETIEQSICIKLEIIQCHRCKVLFEEWEQLENHMLHCLDQKSNRLYDDKLDMQRKPADDVKETLGNVEISTADHLKKYLNTHNSKPFECDTCKMRFTQKYNLKVHIRNRHSNTNEKEYKCTECSYQTNYKYQLKTHLNTHYNIKPFECDICKKRFTWKDNLKVHITNIHSNTSDKEYKCTECSYQTNRKDYLNAHLNTHCNIKPFECDVCKKRFTQKINLKAHIINKHSNSNERKYKCTECSYQTDCEIDLKTHLNIHKNIKAFECDICKKRFNQKSCLKMHIMNMHSNANEKKHKCSECSFQTNYKHHLKTHLNIHNNIKAFECNICKKRFIREGTLKIHIEDKHSNTNNTNTS